MKPLIIIPARGGSKGVPKKNIKLLNGQPLIHYTLKAAQNLFSNQIICVSTDDVEIKKCAEELAYLVPFLRPSQLAQDRSSMNEVILHALDYYENNEGYIADVIVLLQPTSPFRSSKQIEEALKYFKMDLDMVVSVKETHSNPYYVLFEEDGKGFLKKSKSANFNTRQECPKVWEYNGAIYIINVRSLKEKGLDSFDRIVKYEMDEFTSHDIDSMLDWKVAEVISNQIILNVKS